MLPFKFFVFVVIVTYLLWQSYIHRDPNGVSVERNDRYRQLTPPSVDRNGQDYFHSVGKRVSVERNDRYRQLTPPSLNTYIRIRSKRSMTRQYPRYQRKNSCLEEAIKFMERTNAIDIKLSHELIEASYNYQTNLTDYNREIRNRASAKYEQFSTKTKNRAKLFNWRMFENENATLYRWFQLFVKAPMFDHHGYLLPKLSSQSDENPTMEEIFHNATVCRYKEEDETDLNCNLQLEPDVMTIMANSRNPHELESVWTRYRDATGKKMRQEFLYNIEDFNNYAKLHGFRNYKHVMINEYESKTFVDDMAKIMQRVKPLYEQFHAYVRRKLIEYYKDVDILEEGPIPAHLLGDLYAQNWANIFDIVNPYPNKEFLNVTKILIEKKVTPLDMFVIAEKFFVSIGLERMTPYFWAKSVIVKPTDKDIVCHATAWDFANGKDFRVKMCTTVNERSFRTIHHEMGHIAYFMLYKHLPIVFREGANPGFHEAVGEVMSLSASTIDYLKRLSLIDNDFEDSEEIEIMRLMDLALKYLPTIPYAYIIDHYRYNIYNGTIQPNELNTYWWKYRLEYQGVCPPVPRSEDDLDAAAKYHVAMNIEYMSPSLDGAVIVIKLLNSTGPHSITNRHIFFELAEYFFANIFEFQIHKSLCKKINHEGPLHKCNIFNNTVAGNLLREVLSLGKSKPWKEVMKMLDCKAELSADAFLEYFKPLEDWLMEQNQDQHVGWASKEPLKCPKWWEN